LPILAALEAGQAPQYAGLRRDERDIVVGEQGIVIVAGARRLSAFLAALSHVVDLARGVQVEALADSASLVALVPPDDEAAPSRFYDIIQGALAAARLSSTRARLYVGDGRVFVPYADSGAPHGYDAQGSAPPQGRVVLTTRGAQALPAARPAAMLDALLAVPLQPATPPAPNTLTVLTDRRIASLVATYIQHHGLAYAVRFLTWRTGDSTADAALFDIVNAGEVRPVAGFVADFLRRLPRTALLTDALESADLEAEPSRRVLVAWGRRTPLYLPHVQDLLPASGILILAERPWGAALISPPPPRQPMQRLTEVATTAPGRVGLSEQAAGQLRLELALVPGAPAHGPVHGLLLDGPGLERLRRMVRRLPAPLFARARIALGDGVAVLVAAEQGEIAGLPIGQPLARTEPPELLLPRGMRLLPALPQDLLAPALGLQADTLTVLTPTRRYDVPLAALQPLASLLALDAPAQTTRIEMQPSALPELDLSGLEEAQPALAPVAPPADPPPASAPEPAAETEHRGLLRRLLDQMPSRGSAGVSFDEQLRQLAAEYEQQGQYELAAAFYTHLKDLRRAAACYRRLTPQQ
jgi:hypothetical protein